MAKSSIEWTDMVWNPVTGCRKVSAGCKNCYAERIAGRFWGERKFTDVRCHEDRLDDPLRWKKPRRVFVNSMSDLFHEDVPDMFIEQVIQRMCDVDWHTFMVLTKRPRRMLEYLTTKNNWGVLPNVWLGVSVENQQAADERIPLLLQTPAAVRFVSCEPLLGPVELSFAVRVDNGAYGYDALTGRHFPFTLEPQYGSKLDWVIVGGESGPNARPMHPYWVRWLRDQCQAAGVPFFFKQWGAWLPNDSEYGCHNEKANYDRRHEILEIDGSFRATGDISDTSVLVAKMGKQAAGRTIDGREWNEYPDNPQM